MSTITINLNGGDETTTDDNLIYKVYGGVDSFTTPIQTYGSANTDADVSVSSGVATLLNANLDGESQIKVTTTDQAGNESLLSDVYNLPQPPSKVLVLGSQNKVIAISSQNKILNI